MEDNRPTSPPGSPPSTPPPSASPPSEPSSNRTIMVVLSYFGVLALIPLLVEKEDAEVQWHAKHGLILMCTWIALYIALSILAFVPGIGAVLGCAVTPFLSLAIFIIHIICIVKALKDERFRLPVISDFTDQWK